jgi:uncharacterized phage protein (TIGR01671 family)
MRQIKFRAWHEDDKTMVYFNNKKAKTDRYQSSYMIALFDGDFGDVMMQYTGLKDATGKEIYEGDIVKVPFITNHYQDDDPDFKEGYYIGIVSITASKGMCLNSVTKFETTDPMKEYTREKYKRSLSFSASFCFVMGNIREDMQLLHVPKQQGDK